MYTVSVLGMKRRDTELLFFLLAAACAGVLAALFTSGLPRIPVPGGGGSQVAAVLALPYLFNFNQPGVLQEAGSMSESSSPYWWVNSGGALVIENGVGKTMQGNASYTNPWRLLYAVGNALDTDGGAHPQNIFRLVSRSEWQNIAETMSFRIIRNNLSDSPNRDAHNGVLFFGRYQDGDNLYYGGIRDDGQAIIKKKINGTYYTLANVQIFGIEGQYDRATNPSLLPLKTWMGMKMSVQNAWDGSVLIRLYLDRENDGTFVSILSARDQGTGGAPFRSSGYVGIRTDFKDVEFDNFRVTSL